MALRASTDNLSLDAPPVEAPAPLAAVVEFSDLWAHRSALRQACHRLVGDAATAEDVVQDTYLRALRSSGGFGGTGSMAPWLTTVARRRSIDQLRSTRRLTPVGDLPEPDPSARDSDDPAQHVVHQEQMALLRRALAELNPRERQLLLRQVGHGISLAELAAEESTSVASVRSVLARARQKLRSSLERSGALGGVLVPRVLASVRRRLHRAAFHAEGMLPVMSGAGIQLAQVVAVVMVAIASLLGSMDAPDWPGTQVSTAATSVHGAADAGTVEARAGASQPGGTTRAATTAEAAVDRQESPGVALPALSLDVPPPPDGADQPELATVGSFSSSDDGRVVLAAARTKVGDTPAIYRSDDGGHSWTRLNATGYRGGRLLLPPAFPADKRVFAVGAGDVQVSQDGGNSFVTSVPASGEGVLSPGFASGDERVFVSGPPAVLSYRIGDAAPMPFGALPPSTYPGRIDVGPAWASTGELLVGGTTPTGTELNTATLFSCTASGCVQRHAFPKLGGAPRVLTSRTTPGTVVVSLSKLYVSTDGGSTFAQRTVPAGFAIASMYEDSTGALYLAGGSVSSASGLYVSRDFGSTWTALGAGSLVGPGTRAVVRLPSGRLVASLSPSGGVACSADGGTTWAARCAAA